MTILNGICPYFTMFPLSFPHTILRKRAAEGQWVLDPFCGRGTTNFASRLIGLPSIGIDSNPVAVALTQAKLASTSSDQIIETALMILDEVVTPNDIPNGEFWDWAFHPDVLRTVCRLREGLMANSQSEHHKALRGILLGALHGPTGKSSQSYFSNQAQRTYAPKPQYAVKYWKAKNLKPPLVNVLDVIKRRADRFYQDMLPTVEKLVILGDSRLEKTYSPIQTQVSWVITSPPYYGMKTYIPDQWLRLWFLGGPAYVSYSTEQQLNHGSSDYFVSQLQQVWQNIEKLCLTGARLVIRFGGINNRKIEHLPLIKASLNNTGWKIDTIKSAGTAEEGRRQALHFSRIRNVAREEHDVWATLM